MMQKRFESYRSSGFHDSSDAKLSCCARKGNGATTNIKMPSGFVACRKGVFGLLKGIVFAMSHKVGTQPWEERGGLFFLDADSNDNCHDLRFHSAPCNASTTQPPNHVPANPLWLTALFASVLAWL
eukprot:2255828-Amphidinium_carterae.1